jgi:flagellar M-ring protein FliF
MAQFKQLFASLSLKQKVSIGVVAVVIMTALYSFVNWRREQNFKPLYSGVAAEDAAAILQKLKESGTEYRLSDIGGVISVPSEKVAELRLELAAAGLPKSGRIGFELFDKTSFGATEFVEHINYNRALEGELERSINSLSAVQQARVHLTAAKDSVFVESREGAKASVIVKLKPGAALLPPNVSAIQQLVASAVEGLSPEDVSVVDTRGSLLSRRKISSSDDSSDAAFERRQRIEHDLLEKINNTLDPLFGHDKYRAGVTVDCDLSSSEVSEETLDPAKSVMTNSQKTEEVMTGSSVTGIPGTSSNLPHPPLRAGGPTSTTSRRTENVSYASSRMDRKTRIPDGGLKRVSVSVLLDQSVHWEGKGAARKLVATPPTPETIKVIHDVIAGITGFSQERGDQITVESLPFETTLEKEEPLDPGTGPAGKAKPVGWKESLKNPVVMMAAGGGALLVLLLAGGAFFFLRKKKPAVTAESPKAIEGHPAAAGAAPPAAGGQADELQAVLAKRIADQERADMAALVALKLPTVTTKKAELLTREIRENTKKDSTVAAQVLQSWLHENR